MDEPVFPSDRELIEKIAADLAHLRHVLAQWEPLLASIRRDTGGGGGFITAAGMRRAARRAGREAS